MSIYSPVDLLHEPIYFSSFQLTQPSSSQISHQKIKNQKKRKEKEKRKEERKKERKKKRKITMGLFCKSTRKRTTPLLYGYGWSRQRMSPRPDIRQPKVDTAAAAAAHVSYRGSATFPPSSPGVRVSATARAGRRGVRGESSRYRAEGLAEAFEGSGSGSGSGSGLGLRSHTRPLRQRREQNLYAIPGMDDCYNGCDECYVPQRGCDQEVAVACCDSCCSYSFSSPCCGYYCSGRRDDWCPDCEQASTHDRHGSRLDRCCGAGAGCSVDACAYEAGLECTGGYDCSAC